MADHVYYSLQEANAARQIEWDTDNQITLAYRGNELAGEVGEACNVIKKLERERMGILGSRDTVEHLAEELADIEICTGLIAMQAGIDLTPAVIAKFNATSEKIGLKTRMVAAYRSAAIADITSERQRQISVEQWSTIHDDDHKDGEIARAAACYALSAAPTTLNEFSLFLARIWPWGRSFFKPRSKRDDLVRAGALIVAEIERLDRAASVLGDQKDVAT